MGLSRARALFSTALSLTVMIGSCVLARHNLRANRADRKGAARLGDFGDMAKGHGAA